MTARSFEALRFFLRRRTALIAILLIVLVVSAGLEGLTAGALFPFVGAIVGQSIENRGGPILQLLTRAVAWIPVQDRVVATMLLLLTCVVLKGITVLVREALIAFAGARIVHEAKQALLARLATAPYTFFVRPTGKDLTYQLTIAPQSLGAILLLLPYIAMQAFTMAVIVVLLFSMDWHLTVLISLAGMAAYGLIRLVSRRVSYAIGKGQAELMLAEHGFAREFLLGIRDIILNRATVFWTGRLEAASDRSRRLYVSDLVWQAVPGVLIEVLFFAGLSALVVYYRLQAGGSSGTLLPVMAVYAYAVYRLIGTISASSRQVLKVSSKLSDVELLHEAIRTVPQQPLGVGRKDVTVWHGLTFDQVTFVYPGAGESALQDVCFDIPKGAVTAIIGASGSGKSTVINLLARLLEPTGGRILVDGVDLATVDRDGWLWRLGYVGRENFFFDGTVEENIRFGLTAPSRNEVEAVAAVAQAHEFITRLPQGYGAPIGDRGLSLSDGQRQRLAIARVMLRRPELLIFDEGTSAVDPASEALIQQAIAEVAKDLTLVLVAHRVSTLRVADRVVVLNRGRVVEIRSRDELLARQSQYSLLMASPADR